MEKKKGGLIFFDCDGRFERIENKTLLDIYEAWLDDCLKILNRVKEKLNHLPLKEVIGSEWKLKNFSIKSMILSIINPDTLDLNYSELTKDAYLEKEHQKWKNAKK